MGDKTKIDWCDASWNPVTGCYFGCKYCYARGIATRFAGFCPEENPDDYLFRRGGTLVELEGPQARIQKNGKVVPAPYPFGFTPTLHKYKLDDPQLWKKPRTIFVCSMADLFGEWVPEDWIIQVLEACHKAPWHRYLFLTKNPNRYDELEDKGIITPADCNFWLGSTVTVETRDKMHYHSKMHTFQSCEPMLAPWPKAGPPNPESMKNHWMPEWVIFGAETGNRKEKVIPKKEWVDNAVQMCRNMGAAVFMKESLRGIMGPDFVQEYPWEPFEKAGGGTPL